MAERRRAVDVVSSLLSDEKKPAYVAQVRVDQEDLRVKYGNRNERAILTYEAAKANHLQTDWDNLEVAVPWFVGKRVLEN